MKLFKNILPVLLLLSCAAVSAQTADDIIAKNIEAMGGAAKLSSLNSTKLTGSMSTQGQDIPITITKENMKGMRMDIEIMGTSNYQIITPDSGFVYFPIQQMTEPKVMDEGQVKQSQAQLDVQGALFNYKAKGSTVEFVDSEKLGTSEVYNLKLTNKNGAMMNYLIDTKTNRVAEVESSITGPDGQKTAVQTTYSDWKQNADGYWFPYSTAVMQGTITADKIETNVKVDENIFKN